MTASSDASEPDDPPSVERIWKDILLEHGVEDERTARHLVDLAFSDPALTDDRLTAQEARAVVGESLARTDYEPHLEGDVVPDDVRQELMAALDSALAGDLRGPMSAPQHLATVRNDDPPERMGPTASRTDFDVPRPSSARAQRADTVLEGRRTAVVTLQHLLDTMADDVAGRSEPTEETAALVRGLQTTMEEQGIEVADILRALVWIEDGSYELDET